MPTFVMALDAGTTSNRAIMFDHTGTIRAVAQRPLRQIYPKPGWVEHDANDIWSTMLGVAVEAMQKAGAKASDIRAIGITNQRETTIVWDKTTGRPIHNAIVWQCRRTAEMCDRLKARGLAETIRDKTGLVVDAYFSGTKIAWLLDHVDGARARAERGDLLFGTVETWLVWKLTGGAVHATDVSNASRTMLFNLHTMTWDDDLLRILDIPRAMLPEVRPSSGRFGTTDPAFFGEPIVIAGAAGDQQAALFGEACYDPGDVKNTYGTGCFLLMNTGDVPVKSEHGLVTTVAWDLGGRVTYALEGSVFVAGAVVQWLRDELRLIPSAEASEAMAAAVDDTCGCYVVPAFTGLGAPYWDPYARGVIVGLTRGVNREHIVRAALESIAYQTLDVLDAMEKDASIDVTSLKADGGAANNDFLMQFQADIADVPVSRPASVETTALGAAFLAGLAVGVWEDIDALRATWQVDRVFTPAMSASQRRARYAGWRRAVTRSFSRVDGDE